MDDDWDLQAVVRGCAASMTTANNPSPSLPFLDDQNSYDFGNDNDPFHGLQEIYQEFCIDDPPPAAVAAAITSQPHQETVQMKPPLQAQENAHEFNHASFPAALPQPIRPRRRKNQQVKMVRQMTQEELSADSWAWRKYGQKPIKGSPYPRNYYRCSTSKGCAARKQVERSPNDAGIFVVTYTGDHTHPRPSHRSSLAGSTRSRYFSSPPARNNAVKASVPIPLMEGEVAVQNEMAEEEDGDGNNIMIVNDDDEIMKGFEDSDRYRDGGGGLFSPAFLSSSPWSPATGAGV